MQLVSNADARFVGSIRPALDIDKTHPRLGRQPEIPHMTKQKDVDGSAVMFRTSLRVADHNISTHLYLVFDPEIVEKLKNKYRLY